MGDLTDALATGLHGDWGQSPTRWVGGGSLLNLHASRVSILSASTFFFFFFTIEGSVFCRANIGFVVVLEKKEKKGHHGLEVLPLTHRLVLSTLTEGRGASFSAPAN